MDWSAWLPVITVSGVWTVVGIALAHIYRTGVERSLQSLLDRRLEGLRSDLRKDEERFKAELRARDDQIAAQRQWILSVVSRRQESLDKRRLEAIERLWASVVELSPLKVLLEIRRGFKMNEALRSSAEKTGDSANIRKFAETMLNSLNLDRFLKDNNKIPSQDKPFISATAWDLFEVYSLIIMRPYSEFKVLEIGLGQESLVSLERTVEFMKSTFPHQKDFINKFGEESLYFLVNELENRLLNEIRINLEGNYQSEHLAGHLRQSIEKISMLSTNDLSVDPKYLKNNSEIQN